MLYVYDGVLTQFVVDWIKSLCQQYPFVIELSRLPENWNDWQNTNLVEYQYTEKNISGNEYTRKTKMYSLLSNDGSGTKFLFLKSLEEYKAVLRDFREFVVSDKPFKTIVEGEFANCV
jgi:hypothetical protein